MKKNKTTCEHCGSVTSEYVFRFSVLDCRLLLTMAENVKHWMNEGLTFTEANKLHIPSLPLTYTLSARTTIASKLGLIAKVMENGVHKQGYWLVTARGWAALRGEPVPAAVHVFRRKITERTDEITTFRDAWNVGLGKYDSADWVEFGNAVVLS